MRFFQFKPRQFEAFDLTQKEKEQVAFRKSTPTDPHIQKVVNQISAETGVPAHELMQKMQEGMDKLTEVGKYSKLLYDTILLNRAENAAFDLIRHSKNPVNYDNTKFNLGTFLELLQLIQDDYPEIFGGKGNGLAAPGDFRRIYEITPIIVPSSKPEIKSKGFNQVTTAAATADGDFIFNKAFMEQLLYYGAAIDIQPTQAKYECNGGIIPNNYCYIEFLIMHELLHYVYGDFAAGARFKQFSHTVHNWASDLRSNYMLVKNGYTQLPLGLFSNDLNFDRPETDNYEKLVTVVAKELAKLPRQLEAWVEEQGNMDEHEEEQEPWEPQIGEIVIHNKQGTFGRITKILPDGTYETTPVSKEQVEAMYPGIQVG
jgi:hypothetical protein